MWKTSYKKKPGKPGTCLKWRRTLIGKEPDLNSGDGLKATAGSSPAVSLRSISDRITKILTAKF